MNIGVIVFAYNRSRHLKKTLDGLRENEGISRLYIFQDGLKCESHRNEWEMTQQVIKNIDWCEVVYRLSSYNKGLADSIVDGINSVFEDNDAVVVLEDDCVPMANFIGFMRQCFEKYQNDKRVFSVSGYSWPIDLPKDEYDVYGCGRISSWGWGTWKDRWMQYCIDDNILMRLKGNEEKSRYLAAWGSDCEQMLLDRIAGKNNSWAVYWALLVIENRGICINPYQSLVYNIGMDGTGVHCGEINQREERLDSGAKVNFNLLDDPDILHTTEYAFAELYGSYTASNVKEQSKEDVLVYGLGNFFHMHEKEMNKNYNIIAFIDQWKKGWYAGRKILNVREVVQYDYDKIIVMVQSMQECIRIAKNMIHNGIDHESILLGHGIYGNYSKTIDEMCVMHDANILLKFADASIIVESQDEFNNVCEVFLDKIYSYFINNARRDIVIDVGMNIGDSSIYFALQPKVDKVYGYEPFKKTFMRAESNLKQYIDIGKVNAFQYGISNESTMRTIGFNADMTCAQSTLKDVREYAYDKYREWGLAEENNEQSEQIEVRKASEVFEPILNEYPHHNIILKLDCEGEEYGIFEELLQSGILGRFKFIMLEWHYKGKEMLLECLKKAGFSWWCSEKGTQMGLVYAYNAND